MRKHTIQAARAAIWSLLCASFLCVCVSSEDVYNATTPSSTSFFVCRGGAVGITCPAENAATASLLEAEKLCVHEPADFEKTTMQFFGQAKYYDYNMRECQNSKCTIECASPLCVCVGCATQECPVEETDSAVSTLSTASNGTAGDDDYLDNVADFLANVTDVFDNPVVADIIANLTGLYPNATFNITFVDPKTDPPDVNDTTTNATTTPNNKNGTDDDFFDAISDFLANVTDAVENALNNSDVIHENYVDMNMPHVGVANYQYPPANYSVPLEGNVTSTQPVSDNNNTIEEIANMTFVDDGDDASANTTSGGEANATTTTIAQDEGADNSQYSSVFTICASEDAVLQCFNVAGAPFDACQAMSGEFETTGFYVNSEQTVKVELSDCLSDDGKCMMGCFPQQCQCIRLDGTPCGSYCPPVGNVTSTQTVSDNTTSTPEELTNTTLVDDNDNDSANATSSALANETATQGEGADYSAHSSLFTICGSEDAVIECFNVTSDDAYPMCESLSGEFENIDFLISSSLTAKFELKGCLSDEGQCMMGCFPEQCTCVRPDGTPCGSNCRSMVEVNPPPSPPQQQTNVQTPVSETNEAGEFHLGTSTEEGEFHPPSNEVGDFKPGSSFSICGEMGTTEAVIKCKNVEEDMDLNVMCDYDESLFDYSRAVGVGKGEVVLYLKGCSDSICRVSCTPKDCACLEAYDESGKGQLCGLCDDSTETEDWLFDGSDEYGAASESNGNTIDTVVPTTTEKEETQEDNLGTLSSTIADGTIAVIKATVPNSIAKFYTIGDAIITCSAESRCQFDPHTFVNASLVGGGLSHAKSNSDLIESGDFGLVNFNDRDILKFTKCLLATSSSSSPPGPCEIVCSEKCECVTGDATPCTKDLAEKFLEGREGMKPKEGMVRRNLLSSNGVPSHFAGRTCTASLSSAMACLISSIAAVTVVMSSIC